MRRLRLLFNRIIRFLLSSKPSRPEDIPKKLDASALGRAMKEAHFLQNHSVEVRALKEDELPGLPRRADK